MRALGHFLTSARARWTTVGESRLQPKIFNPAGFVLRKYNIVKNRVCLFIDRMHNTRLLASLLYDESVVISDLV